jgi:rifampicin phosphotransferase
MRGRMIGGHLYSQMLMEGGDQKGTPPGWVLWLVSRLLPSMRKMNNKMKAVFDQKLHHKEMQLWYDEVRPYFESKNKVFASTNVDELTDEELLQRWHEIRKHFYKGIDAHADRMGSFVAIGEFYLFCKDHLAWDNETFFSITAGWSSASSLIHDSLFDLCRSNFSSKELREDPGLHAGIHTFLRNHTAFKKQVDDWIKENALRMQDYDLINPTLGENPGLIYQNIEAILKELGANGLSKSGKNPERDAAFASARQKLAGTSLLAEFEELAKWCKVAYSQRDENGLFTIAQTCSLVRLQLIEMAKRMGMKESEDIFFLQEDEVEEAFIGQLENRDERIKHRKGEKQWAIFNRGPKRYGDPEPPMPSPDPFPEAMRKMFRIFAWIEEVDLGDYENEKSASENVIPGRAASAGVHKGKAKIIKSPKDFDKLETGDVMVCRITTGEWSMVFSRVGGLVTEEGGMLSHPAIIAREFGIPAVVGTEIAMQKIKDGMDITVDGNKGQVYIFP